jgi:hypothetical protein
MNKLGEIPRQRKTRSKLMKGFSKLLFDKGGRK